MLERRSILALETFELPAEPTPEQLTELREGLSRSAARRMTTLGLCLHRVLRSFPTDASIPLIYGTTFAESGALEKYLASFPTPSPLQFQASIHPAGIEQVRVAAQLPLHTFYPFAGREGLASRILQASLLLPQEHVIVCGGEERGQWLVEHGLAGERTFAFALLLGTNERNGPNVVCCDATPSTETMDGLGPLFDALRVQRTFSLPAPGLPAISLRWNPPT